MMLQWPMVRGQNGECPVKIVEGFLRKAEAILMLYKVKN
jgi:hypothetical protein